MAEKKTVGKYTLANIIQYDSLGDVYNAPLDEDQSVWVKLLSVCPKEVKFPESRDLRTQIATQLQEFKHLSIAKLQKLILDKSSFYFIYDSTAGPSLVDALLEKPFTVPQIRQFLVQLFVLFRTAHEQKIFHGKLIPDRICFNEDLTQIKVRELGLRQLLPANYFPKLTPKQKLIEAQFCQFIAPEAVENKYDSTYDVWSVGALAYYMLTRELPYPAANTVQQYLKAARTSPVFPEKTRENSQLVNLIIKMMVFENRPAFADLITHPFIQDDQPYFDKWEQQCAKFLIVRKKKINADGDEEIVEEGAEKEKAEGAEGEEEVEKIDVGASEVGKEKSEEKAEKEENPEEKPEAKEEKAEEKAEEKPEAQNEKSEDEQVVEKTEEVKSEDEQQGQEQLTENDQRGNESNVE